MMGEWHVHPHEWTKGVFDRLREAHFTNAQGMAATCTQATTRGNEQNDQTSVLDAFILCSKDQQTANSTAQCFPSGR
jgi:hypothetical protein